MLPPKKVVNFAAMARSPELLKAAIASLKVETNPRYVKRVVASAGMRTFCNWFVEDLCALLGVSIPRGLLAKQQIQWLRTAAARNEGWFENLEPEANEFAAKGHPVIVGWINPDPTYSSHIAMMCSPGRIAQAGASNFSDGDISRGFGARLVNFWAHL